MLKIIKYLFFHIYKFPTLRKGKESINLQSAQKLEFALYIVRPYRLYFHKSPFQLQVHPIKGLGFWKIDQKKTGILRSKLEGGIKYQQSIILFI